MLRCYLTEHIAHAELIATDRSSSTKTEPSSSLSKFD